MKNGRLMGKIFGIGLMLVVLTSTFVGLVWECESDVVRAGYIGVTVEQVKQMIDSDPDTADITVWIPATIDFQLSLQPGWNMVSVPVTPIDNSTSAVFPGVAGIFTWNAASRSYYVPTVIDPEKGLLGSSHRGHSNHYKWDSDRDLDNRYQGRLEYDWFCVHYC